MIQEVYDGEYEDGASIPTPPEQKMEVEAYEPPYDEEVKVEELHSTALPDKNVKVEKYNLRTRKEAKEKKPPTVRVNLSSNLCSD